MPTFTPPCSTCDLLQKTSGASLPRRATARSFVPSGEDVMKRSRPSMDKILEAQIQVLTTTRRPKTVKCYRYCVRNFLAYLHTTFPHLRQLSQLRRDPHLLAWFRSL